MAKDNLGYYDVYPYKDEPDEDEPEENLDSMGYRLDKTDDNDWAYDRWVDEQLSGGAK